MTKTRLWLLSLLAPLAACSLEPTDIQVGLAPQVVSSLDGTLGVRATVYSDEVPLSEEALQITVSYTDRKGATHEITGAEGTSDDKGVFEATLSGLAWDGTGTVTVTVPGTAVSGKATFAVLDRTPPKAEILPTSLTVTRNSDVTVPIHVQDEIGVSQVVFETFTNFDGGIVGRDRSTVVASGSADSTVSFEFQVRDNLPGGTTITLYALVTDLSGNQAAAAPVTLTVNP